MRGAYLRVSSAVYRSILKRSGIMLGPGVRLLGKPIVTKAPLTRIEIGSRATLTSRPYWTALGTSRPVILRTLHANAEIVIGDDCGFSGTTICAARSIRIGNGCLFGADVLIADTDFHPVDALGRRHLLLPTPEAEDAVVIGDDVFVGARSIVLKGVTIGSGAVIGAGSLVSSDIPSHCVAAGNPARVLRPIIGGPPVAPPIDIAK